MENEAAVFSSDITRGGCEQKNNLYDLLNVIPAEALPANSNIHETCDFSPNYNKRYIPKKGSKLKVKTVKDIRATFEKDIYTYLPDDIEKQENYLLRKIRSGSLNNQNTKETAKNIVNGYKPISRSAWQMLANINPENHSFPRQFVLWKGTCIQINGSKGGKNKFLCNYDLSSNNKIRNPKIKNTPNLKKSMFKSRLGLLRNSLKVQFKPGPLRKKEFLDDSHHKYHMGRIELCKLPTPALDIYPVYGTVLESSISNFINNLRDESGIVSQKWAEFSVSVVGTVIDKTPTQLDKNCCITFDLNYKCDQNRLLMRRNDVDTISNMNVESNSHRDVSNNEESKKKLEIKEIMNEMLSSVEISLQQDNMYSMDDNFCEIAEESFMEINCNTKDKSKRRYCELDRLDVTVIKVPENSPKEENKPCGKSFCALGCICESLNCAYNLKQHCGILDCMFGCKCDLSKYKDIELLAHDCSDIIPGLLKLDKEINSHLTKEEQKFHQTVIVSGEKSILLKSRKRNWKTSKKYADFYCDLNLKSDEKIHRILTIVDKKLNCENIEPWCMVHNLYKCFCKGIFTEPTYCVTEINPNKTTNKENTKVEQDIISDKDGEVKSSLRPRRLRPDRKSYDSKNSVLLAESNDSVIDLCSDDSELRNSSARTEGYTGRKYDEEYYKTTNLKILDMEQNDNLLRNKMLSLMQKANESYSQSSKSTIQSCESPDVTLDSEHSNDSVKNKNSEELSNPFSKNSNKCTLKAWLEISFRKYKERLSKGLKNCLSEPRLGLSCLQPWDFILSRYRERKNIYFVTKQRPFRTFLAIDPHHPFFVNCLNIDDIRFADLPKYPLIIQNLLTNATDVENSFCMLRGWNFSWELMGSAVRIVEKVDDDQSEVKEPETDKPQNDDASSSENNDWLESMFVQDNTMPLQDEKERREKDSHNLESSKWFVLKVENDFTEIQFYKRGFYVTYEGIQRSISIARLSGKTVRLSSQTRSDKNCTPQYGIYAIPSTNECCVFIGPYEVNEPLGIEVVKTFLDPRKKEKTRGVWITTNKIDNMKVIDNPLSFMPSVTMPNESMVTFETSSNINENKKRDEVVQNMQKSVLETNKTIKPIKIFRTNSFYPFSPKKMVLANKPTNLNKNPILMKSPISLLQKSDAKNQSEESSTSTSMAFVKPFAEIAPQVKSPDEITPSTSMAINMRPVAEVAPHITITSVYSEVKIQNKNMQTLAKSKGRSMLVLKPEEINKKMLCNSFEKYIEPNERNDENMDVEGFLASSTICTIPNDVLVISDGEDENQSWKDVWVQCRNVDNFGCIPGRMNNDNTLLSFEFPGFKYSDFYTESEAFDKINQVLARKIYVPNNIKLQWQVIKSLKDQTKYVLTSECLEDKEYLLNKLRKLQIKTTSRSNKKKKGSPSTSHTDEPLEIINKTTGMIEDLEKTSNKLENEGMLLWNEAIVRRSEIMSSLTVPKDLQAEMTEKLEDMLAMNKQ